MKLFNQNYPQHAEDIPAGINEHYIISQGNLVSAKQEQERSSNEPKNHIFLLLNYRKFV